MYAGRGSLKEATLTGHFALLIEETLGIETTRLSCTRRFEKFSFQKVLRPH